MKISLLIVFAVCVAVVSSVPLKGNMKAPMAGVGCNDTQDLTAFITYNSTFHDLLQSCAEKCLGSVSCAIPCIQTNLGLTLDCATCFANDTLCTFNNCKKYCIVDPKGANCLDCSQQYCYPALCACAQVNPDVFPK